MMICGGNLAGKPIQSCLWWISRALPHFVTVFLTRFHVTLFNCPLVWVDGGTWFEGQTMRSELWRQHKDRPKAAPQLHQKRKEEVLGRAEGEEDEAAGIPQAGLGCRKVSFRRKEIPNPRKRDSHLILRISFCQVPFPSAGLCLNVRHQVLEKSCSPSSRDSTGTRRNTTIFVQNFGFVMRPSLKPHPG